MRSAGQVIWPQGSVTGISLRPFSDGHTTPALDLSGASQRAYAVGPDHCVVGSAGHAPAWTGTGILLNATRGDPYRRGNEPEAVVAHPAGGPDPDINLAGPVSRRGSHRRGRARSGDDTCPCAAELHPPHIGEPMASRPAAATAAIQTSNTTDGHETPTGHDALTQVSQPGPEAERCSS
jgi:hypothetical protein